MAKNYEEETYQKIYPAPEYDSERETRVLLEKVSTDVEKIAEQVASNSAKLMKLDKIEQDTEQLKVDMSIVKTAVQRNAEKIDRNAEKIDRNAEKIDRNAEKIDSLSGKVDRIERKLDTVTTDHEHRLQKLESVHH